jgi:hypothetical protein
VTSSGDLEIASDGTVNVQNGSAAVSGSALSVLASDIEITSDGQTHIEQRRLNYTGDGRGN